MQAESDVVVRATRWKSALILLPFLALATLPAGLCVIAAPYLDDPVERSNFVAGSVGLAILYAPMTLLAWKVAQPDTLVMSADHLVFRSLWFSRSWPWRTVRNFRVVYTRGLGTIAFEVVPHEGPPVRAFIPSGFKAPDRLAAELDRVARQRRDATSDLAPPAPTA